MERSNEPYTWKDPRTWWQVENDIRILKRWCNSCNEAFICITDARHSCPRCEEVATWKCLFSPEQLDLLCDEVQECHYMGDRDEYYDMDQEMDAHQKLKWGLQKYDWWTGDRSQLQCMWYELRDVPWSMPGYYASARRYFQEAYAVGTLPATGGRFPTPLSLEADLNPHPSPM